MKLLSTALIALLGAAAPASAARIIVDQIVTPNLPGYRTFTLSILTEGSEVLRGMDATITGAMNQVNPAGIATIFNDANAFFPFVGADPRQDSQFPFLSSTVLSIGGQESSTRLIAAISGLADNGLPNPAPFAQIVTQVPPAIFANVAFDLGGTRLVTFSGSIVTPLTPIFDAAVSIESAPADGLDGHRTYTFWLDYSTNLTSIRLDAAIAGDLSQAPGGPSPFQSDLLPGQLETDSHFLFDRSGIVAVDATKEADTAGLLRADFNFVANSQNIPVSSRVAIAQITTDDPASVTYDFSIEADWRLAPLRLTGTLVPEPATSLLLTIAALAASVRARS